MNKRLLSRLILAGLVLAGLSPAVATAVGSAKVGATEFAVFSADESANVGLDSETPVTAAYDRASSKFTGKIDKVTINLK